MIDDRYDNCKAAFSSMKVKIDLAMPSDQINIEQNGKVVGSIINLEVPKPAPLSIAALKANLFYADAQKQKAFNAHKDALISYHLALDALNQAIVKKNSNG